MADGRTDGQRLRFATIGAGFWARFQLAGWREAGGAECVAIFNRSRSRAERLAAEFGIPAVYDDMTELLDHERLDFVDVITSPETHADYVQAAAQRGLAVICQKPMTPTLAAAEQLVERCKVLGAPLFVHENFRWQRPIREVAAVLAAGTIGRPFRAHLDFSSGFPVFDNQPALATAERFIIADLGIHLLDVARFLFGEAATLSCVTDRVNPGIVGEDVATILMRMQDGVTVLVTMSFASRPEVESFPETLVRIEGDRGTITLGKDAELRVTVGARTTTRRVAPAQYLWADPAYGVVHASIVDCNRNLLAGIAGTGSAETTADDNLRTLRLLEAAYASADTSRVVTDL